MATKRFVIISALLCIVSIFYYHHVSNPMRIPKLENTYWGPGEHTKDDVSIKPFEIELNNKILNDIYHRLTLTRPISTPLESTQTRYGLSGSILKEALEFLKAQYNFTEQRTFLNSVPQFITEIQGLKIHFLHVKPRIIDQSITVCPILLLHGWPSSVREFYGMISKLSESTNGRKFVFEVIAPSLPGFGYSDPPAKKDCQAAEMSLIFKNLMSRLGHKQFYVHGSDWGAVIGTNLATLFPDSVLGFHSNFCVSLLYKSILKIAAGWILPSFFFPEKYKHKWYPPSESIRFLMAESGYLHLQSTKPDTIGVSLDNSIEGLISFMFEKMSVGTNKNFIQYEDAGLFLKYNFTVLLDNLMFYYWIPQKASTAARMYAENLNVFAFSRGINNLPIDRKVPCGCAFFEHEFLYFPESILKDKYTNLVHYTTFEDGGHFAALEYPDELSDDIVNFVAKTLYKNALN